MEDALKGIERIPNDPVAFNRVMLRILKHLDDHEMTLTQQRIITACMMSENPQGKTIKTIAKETGLSASEVERELPDLVKARYLFENVPTFGPVIYYRMGAVGQTFTNAIKREFEKADPEHPRYEGIKKVI